MDYLVGLVESDEQFRDADAWSQATQRFHDLILERAGNRTLAVQAGVLREVVAMHLSTVVMRTFDHPGTQDQFRKMVRSYRKLVLLIDARDADGAAQRPAELLTFLDERHRQVEGPLGGPGDQRRPEQAQQAPGVVRRSGRRGSGLTGGRSVPLRIVRHLVSM